MITPLSVGWWQIVAPCEELAKLELGKCEAYFRTPRLLCVIFIDDADLMHYTPEATDVRERASHVVA
jgi:hypothetical protein